VTKVVLVGSIIKPIPDWVARKLEDAGIEYLYQECHGREDLIRYASDADVLWFMCSRRGVVVEENMDIFAKLKAVVKCGSGTDNIDHAACTKRGIVIAHTPEDVTDAASDHSIAMLLSTARQVTRQDRLVRAGGWDPEAALPIGRLTGANLGLVGFGRIGRAVVSKLSGFQMNVRIYDPYADISADGGGAVKKVALQELLEESQYVILACPLTQETRGIIGEKQLRAMRGESVLVNCARAEIVDEQALARALREGWIRAAAIDVCSRHPLNPEDELLMENIIITPHMGGHPSNYPDSLYVGPVEAIIEVSRNRLPRWIANANVEPWWVKSA
jgi:phosphoglycerate dehydrogenase-like enzyme